jgi:N-acetylglutamate synthase-like GNAT family acetyltransferase
MIRVRIATVDDVPALRALIDASVRGLQTRDYSAAVVERALATVYGVDTQLIADGTYAMIRAFFVHPDWARRGIGTKILDACEGAARAAGYTRCEMGATLTGVPFYEARGYTAVESLTVPLAGGDSMAIVRMEKRDLREAILSIDGQSAV